MSLFKGLEGVCLELFDVVLRMVGVVADVHAKVASFTEWTGTGHGQLEPARTCSSQA